MLSQWLVNELFQTSDYTNASYSNSQALANYYTLPEQYLWAKIAVAVGAPRSESDYISLPKNYVWKDIYDAVSGSSNGTIDWGEKQAVGHIAAAYRGDTGNPANLATYIDWPWRYQVAAISVTTKRDLPTFIRDFAGLKTLNHGVGPTINFTRNSNATYFDSNGILQLASENQPRFDHDPATGASRGLLIEESRTNLLQRSAEFNDAYWTKTNTTVTANDAIAPDGTTTADLIEKTGNDATTPGRTLAVAAVAHTASCFVKNVSGDRFRIRFDATGGTIVDAVFNLVTGAVASTGAGVTASIQSFGNGWYRCAATYTFASAVNASIGFSPRNVNAADSTGAKAHLWGAQLEAGAFATSYIPTTGDEATRAADSAVVTPISSFYNQSEGTLFAEYRTGAGTPAAGVIVADDGTNDNRVGLFSTTAQVAIGAAFTSFGSITPTANTVFKSVIGYKANDHAASANGAAVSTNTEAGVPAGITTLVIGAEFGGQFSHLCGHIRKVAYWPRRLSNTLLQQLTT
jgi:hypothetical protein